MFEGQNKLIIILVALIAGSFGIHNFAMGEMKKGIVRLAGTLLCGVVGVVLAYLDVIKMVQDKYVIDPESFI